MQESEINLFSNWEGVTKEFTVDERIYRTFQELSGDMNPLHTNRDFAAGKGFADRVMYGNILNAFVSYGIGMALPTPNVMIQTQDIAFKKPVFMGDTLTMEMKTDEVHESVNAVVIAFKFTNRDNKVVAKGHVQIGVFAS